MNLPSISNFNSPFQNSWSRKLKNVLQRPSSAFLSQIFKFKIFQQIQFCLCLFGKNHIIYYPVFPCIFTEEIMAAKIPEVAEISEVAEIHYFRQQNICWGNSFYVGLLVWQSVYAHPITMIWRSNRMNLQFSSDAPWD